jgi:hypothetical protein
MDHAATRILQLRQIAAIAGSSRVRKHLPKLATKERLA